MKSNPPPNTPSTSTKMTATLDLLGALLVGLAGAGHCIGMCGGVSAALSMAIPAEKQHFWGRLGYLLNYNLGRILSYVIAGALVGGLLATTSELGAGKHAIAGLRLVAAFLMIALGLVAGGVAARAHWRQVVASPQAAGGQVHPLHFRLAGTAVWHGVGLAPLRAGLLHADLERSSGIRRRWSAGHALFRPRHPADPVCAGRVGGSAALLADPAQFAPWWGPAAHCIRAAYPLDRDCVLLKPYPKRMS